MIGKITTGTQKNISKYDHFSVYSSITGTIYKDSSITPGIRITVYTGIYILCHMSICKQDKGISKVR